MATKFSDVEKIIVRNQRLIMLALANMLNNPSGACSGYHRELLQDRIRLLEANCEWIAPPSERL